MTSGGNDFSDFPKNQLHSRQKNKLHLTKSGGLKSTESLGLWKVGRLKPRSLTEVYAYAYAYIIIFYTHGCSWRTFAWQFS